jgi:hypothetical protein
MSTCWRGVLPSTPYRARHTEHAALASAEEAMSTCWRGVLGKNVVAFYSQTFYTISKCSCLCPEGMSPSNS